MMNEYFYVNNEISEGLFIILQTLDALEYKYSDLPIQIKKDITILKEHLTDIIELKDTYSNLDLEGVKLIHQYVYNNIDDVEGK